MTRVIIWGGALMGAIGGGWLGYVLASWWELSSGFRLPLISLGALAGGLLGMLLGYIAAGLMET